MSLDNLKTILNAIKYLLTDYPKKKDIPTKLPNPNPLTFTGAVTGSYDGSEALTVEISSGGGGAGAMVVTFTATNTGLSADKTVEEVTAAMASMPVIGNLIISTGETPVTMHLGACCSELSTSEIPTPAFGPFSYDPGNQLVLGFVGVNSSGQWEARGGS